MAFDFMEEDRILLDLDAAVIPAPVPPDTRGSAFGNPSPAPVPWASAASCWTEGCHLGLPATMQSLPCSYDEAQRGPVTVAQDSGQGATRTPSAPLSGAGPDTPYPASPQPLASGVQGVSDGIGASPALGPLWPPVSATAMAAFAARWQDLTTPIKAIAAEFGVAIRTVQRHRKRLGLLDRRALQRRGARRVNPWAWGPPPSRESRAFPRV